MKYRAVISGVLLYALTRHVSAAEPEVRPVLEVSGSWAVPAGHALVLMTGMRAAESVIWPEPFADLRSRRVGRSYGEAFSRPPKWDGSRAAFEWDGDPWYVNALGHGLFGSELYLRARSCGQTPPLAFAFTAAGSTLWEYGIEASAVRPSALDLWYTPLSGLVFGELRFLGYRAAGSVSPRAVRGLLRVVLDPFGEFERSLGTPC